MNKQLKAPPTQPSHLILPSPRPKVLPLKQKFLTLTSENLYTPNSKPHILQTLVKNPKWCHISLKYKNSEASPHYSRLRRARSLRLRSVHLETYIFFYGAFDIIHLYSGELAPLNRAGNTLKKLSLSTGTTLDKEEPYHHLKRFVKKQKHLDELGLYIGSLGCSKWMADLLKYPQKTVKTLTIENMAVEHIFEKYEFPKLETLRFEYIQFYNTEESFDFFLLRKSLSKILKLPLLKSIVFSQYQRLSFEYTRDSALETLKYSRRNDEENIEFVEKFWEGLKAELDKKKDKPLRIKYHRKDDSEIEKKAENFKRIFEGLPSCQTFEYEVVEVEKLSNEEVEAHGLENWGSRMKTPNYHWKGVRYLISLGKVEAIWSH